MLHIDPFAKFQKVDKARVLISRYRVTNNDEVEIFWYRNMQVNVFELSKDGNIFREYHSLTHTTTGGARCAMHGGAAALTEWFKNCNLVVTHHPDGINTQSDEDRINSSIGHDSVIPFCLLLLTR